ncbi:response regulator transcription factor [Suttonella indologenes]|uniref:Chemotaxis protein CheY n=1 Tax=Suttonella indologenes TaxID=13276 RepID=A0A380MV22_9GAMM|nr:response regulator [Suttonella indologenes]SUO96405.1 Chemotaxis protein CheY [Suttonella indologenes]
MAYTLMVVDDSNIIRNRITRSFADSDIQIVASAKDGEEAVAKFDQFRPDLVTMDLTMPHMDGLECIKQLVAKGTGVSILVVSALSDKATALLALQYGARGFICKPFNENDIKTALERMIAMQEKAKK